MVESIILEKFISPTFLEIKEPCAIYFTTLCFYIYLPENGINADDSDNVSPLFVRFYIRKKVLFRKATTQFTKPFVNVVRQILTT